LPHRPVAVYCRPHKLPGLPAVLHLQLTSHGHLGEELHLLRRVGIHVSELIYKPLLPLHSSLGDLNDSPLLVLLPVRRLLWPRQPLVAQLIRAEDGSVDHKGTAQGGAQAAHKNAWPLRTIALYRTAQPACGKERPHGDVMIN